jgi:aminoglycoside phosphotransferase (APT) family kinase protein
MINQSLIKNILNEAEFKQGGFVWSHMKQGKSDSLVAVRSAVDRMRELHDIPDNQFNSVCNDVLFAMQQRVGGC